MSFDRLIVHFVGSLVLACGFLAAPAGARPDEGHPLLLISVDGMRPGDVFAGAEQGMNLPTLQRMIAQGASARAVRNVTPTITMPNHLTLVTGVAPAAHGVYDNLVFDPLRHHTDRYFWFAKDIKVPTLWDVVKANGGVTASLYWPTTVGADAIDINVPLYWRDMDFEDIKHIAALSTPRLVAELERATGRKLVESMLLTPAADQVIGVYAEHVLSTRRPRLLTVHLSAYDHVAHVTGPDSPEAHAALENTDAVIGAIITAGRKAMPGLVVAVVSDHGFAPLHDDVNLLKPFVDAGLAKFDPTTGQFTGWEAMPWGYAAAAVFLARPSDQELQARTKTLLTRLAADPAYHIRRIEDLTTTADSRAGRAPAFYIGFEAGYEMGQNIADPLLLPSKYKGMHGYLNDMSEMHSSLFIAGPGIAHGMSLGEIDMVDIAPTLATILGVRLPRGQGNVLPLEDRGH